MGITLFKDIDYGYIPPTPVTPYLSSDEFSSLSQARDIIFKYSKEFGYPISYIQEQDGQLIQNIVPVNKTEYQQISTSSKTELALHTETAFHPYKPDYVLLFCLRGDPSAITTYANFFDILKQLDESVINILKKKCFTTGIDISFRSNGELDQQIYLSIIDEVGSLLSFTYDEALIDGVNGESRNALHLTKLAIQNCTQEIVLATGDLLVIDNKKTIHGRKPFQPRYNGTDRWVQRVLVKKEIPPSNQINGHIITTRFGV
ncbi:TauD/TfdA family dioxygenase [Flavobacterium sp.]|uniref:TauD/TfdA family dioxygenase n=1 Tax=Flavobacterium sp. TaxID=239 RepID=UPI003BC7C8AE